MTVNDASLGESGSKLSKVAATSLLMGVTRASSEAYVSTEGLFSANVNIYNQTVTITGRVVNGVPKVGTMYIVR